MKKKRLIRFPSLLKRYKKNLMIMKWCIAYLLVHFELVCECVFSKEYCVAGFI